MAVTVRAVTPAVGAEISGVDLRRLERLGVRGDRARLDRPFDDPAARPDSSSDDDLLAFSRRFGELDPPPNQERGRISPPGYPDVYVVSNVLDAKGDPIGALGAGEAVWHTDMSYLDTPPDASMLYSLEIPPSRRQHLVLRHAGGLRCAAGRAAAQDRGPAHQARRHLQFGRLPAQRRDADRRSHGRARRLASGDPAPSRQRPRHALSRTAAQLLHRGLFARRVRCAARRRCGRTSRSRASSTSMSGSWATS